MKKLTILAGILLFGLTSMNVSAQDSAEKLDINTIIKLDDANEFENYLVGDDGFFNGLYMKGLSKKYEFREIEGLEPVEVLQLIMNYEQFISNIYSSKINRLQMKINSLEAQLGISKSLNESSIDTNERLRSKLQEKQLKENARAIIIYR